MAEEVVRTYFKTALRDYTFDAIFSTNISSTLEITQHPIQTNVDITDHAFENGKQLTFQIGMSDVMKPWYNGIVDFDGSDTRSVNAYKTLQKMQSDRIPIEVTNKFGSFKNMLVQSLMVEDTKETKYGLKATVCLKEIFVVNVAAVKVSARPEVTEENNEGAQNAQKISEYSDIQSRWKAILGG